MNVRAARGALHLDHALVARHLAGAGAVALLAREGFLLILPLHAASTGGYLLKQRNAAGDRVVHAGDLLRDLLPDETERSLDATWDTEMAGLSVRLP